MKRGDIVTVAAPGDYGKPRPVVIVQTDALNQLAVESVIVCPLTSTIRDAPLFRIQLEPSAENGLAMTSQIMVDKPQAVALKRLGAHIGRISDEEILRLNRTLAFVVGIG